METDILPSSVAQNITEFGPFSRRKLDQLVPYPPRPFSMLEVELTTRCTLSCPSCPRTTFRRSWIEADMSLETFERISPAFSQFEMIHFRGWGESTLNPYFPEMVRLAYQSGARLVLSTNGAGCIDRSLIPYFHTIAYRLDYGRAATFERRNPGARFNRVMYNIRQAIEISQANQEAGPRIMLLFVKNKYSLRELPSYLDTALRLNPDVVAFYSPFFHVRPIDAASPLPGDVDEGLIKKVFDKLEQKASGSGVKVINMPTIREGRSATACGLNLGDALFVNVSGRLALCRYSALPVAGGSFSRFIGVREEIFSTTLFGSLVDGSLENIISGRQFKRFRRSCRNGLERMAETDAPCALKMPRRPRPKPRGKLIRLRPEK